jgi:hypothetical protein
MMNCESEKSISDENILQVSKIAVNTLLKCHKEGLGFVAGSEHFPDFWRDSLFASIGAIESHEQNLHQGAVDTINTFVKYSRKYPDGSIQIPYRILLEPMTFLKYLGIKSTPYESPHPGFRLRYTGGTVHDSGLLTILAIQSLLSNTNQSKNDEARLTNLSHQILNRFENSYGVGAIWDNKFSEWADCIAKKGYVLYTNILYAAALNSAAEINSDYKSWYLKREQKLMTQLRQTLWTGSYFADWSNGKKRFDFFSTHANLLSIVLGVASEEETNKILAYISENKLQVDFTLETNFPAYPDQFIDKANLLFLPGYHNYGGFLWLEPGILYAAANIKADNKKRATEILTLISKQILKCNKFYEVYDRNGDPINIKKGLFRYPAEPDFARSAGLFLLTNSMLKQM